MRRPFATGCYELLADGRLFGWLTDQNGNPAPGVVKVNGNVATSIKPGRRPRGWPWTRGGTPRLGRFETRLRLDPGDRVEVVHGLTGQPLPKIMPHKPAPGWRPRVAILSPVKQEAAHLLEWMAYHRALGISSFVLGDNGGSDHTSVLLQALDAAGLATRLDWRGELAFQERFDVAAVEQVCGLVDICAIIDVDEFLRPLGGRDDIAATIAEIFSDPETSAAGINWVIYGSAGRIVPGEGLVLERFTRRAPDDHALHRVVKSLVRPERFAGMGNPHVVRITAGKYVNDRGLPARWIREPACLKAKSWSRLRLDHFVIKSRQEFEMKVSRGRPDAAPGVADRDEAFFASRDRNEVFDPMPVEFVVRTRQEMARIVERLKPYVASNGPIAERLHA